MYKKMNRVIEKEKGESLLSKGIRLFLATDNETLCELDVYRIYKRNSFLLTRIYYNRERLDNKEASHV
ncbi:hypothetical protein EXW34_31465 (plasmid) [Bacillus mycoides]|nr:hypothetical protein EXW34_31465 [Bacillus mycoides]